MAVKEYKFKIGGVKGRKLSLLHDLDDNSMQVLVDGTVAEKDEKGTRYIIQDDNGNDIKFESGLDERWKPWLKANGEDVKLAAPLAWYQWAWIGLPLILVVLGGAIGGMIGGAAAYLNMVIMQTWRSAALRYLATFGVSVCAFILYMVIAVIISVMFGTKEGKSLSEEFRKGFSSVSESFKSSPSKPENIPNIYVDNGSERTLGFSVDGKAQAELKPFECRTMNLKAGKHKLVFTDNGSEIDSIELDVDRSKAYALNPKALCSYVIEKASYSSYNLVAGGGTGFETVKGQKIVSADYGLAESIPDKIEVKAKPGDMGQITYRTRFMRAVPENPGSQQAYVLLKNKKDTLSSFYYDDQDKLVSSLLAALGKEPLRPEHRDLLLEKASSSEKYVLNAALKSLKPYEEQIPDEKLMAFVMAEEKVSSAGMPYDSPAVDGRSGWAMKMLMKRNKAEPLVKDFARLQPNKKGYLLKYLSSEGTDELRKSLVEAVLSTETIQDEFMLSSLLTIIVSKDFNPDPAQMEKIEAYIPKIQLERTRKHWESTWRNRIMELASAGQPNEFVLRKLREYIKDDNRDSKVVMLLLKGGDYKTVKELFGDLKGYEKMDVLRALPLAKNGKVPDDSYAIAWAMLDEKDDNMWRYGLHYLVANSPSTLEFLRKAWAYSSNIADEKRKASFNRELMSSSYSKLDEMGLGDLCKVAAEAPAEDFVKRIIERLEREDGKRAGNFNELAKVYPAAGDLNRTMMMKQMKNVSYLQFAFRKPDEFKAIVDFLKLGLADKSQTAREAALEAAFRMDNGEFPPEDLADQIIKAASSEEAAKNLRRDYGRWICDAWKNRTNDRNTRAKALSKISVVLESTEDKDIAKLANNSLENPDEAEKAYVEALIRIADKNMLAEARQDCLRRLSSIDFIRNPAVLAQMIKSLDDPDLNVKYQAFTSLSHKVRDDKEGKILQALKTAVAKEADQKTKADMERLLKSVLPPEQNPPQQQKPPPQQQQQKKR